MITKTRETGDKVKISMQKGTELIERLLIDGWPMREGKNMNKEVCVEHYDFNISDIVEIVENSFYQYMGSESEPPCREGVRWTVFEQPILVSSMVMHKLKSKVLGRQSDNSRAQQSSNHRQVYYHHTTTSPPCPDQPKQDHPLLYFQVEADNIQQGVIDDDSIHQEASITYQDTHGFNNTLIITHDPHILDQQIPIQD